jgi:hypothetical protein
MIMAKKPANSGKPWSSADDRQLRKEAAGNTPTRVIALHLERSEDAVRSRGQRPGYLPQAEQPEPVRHEEEEVALRGSVVGPRCVIPTVVDGIGERI